MKTLCLFTNEFPYGNWEPYLETEVQFYDFFDKVYVFSLQLRENHMNQIRKLPQKFEVIPIKYAARWVYFFNSVVTLTDKNLYKELLCLIKTGRFGISHLIDLFVYFSRSHYEVNQILKKVNKNELKNTFYYSYRFEYQPYVAILLRKKINSNARIISRAHGFDLYEERHVHKYIPCRNILLENLDYVFPCSNDGTLYLQRLFPKYKNKVETRFLGTIGHGIQNYTKDSCFRIVSCSTVTQVKRLDLLIEALKIITNKEIVWTHFGDGVMMTEIKEKAAKLPSNIAVDFRGNISNDALLSIYSENVFDLFVNVSESEGIPVSIMEALSFGIPCLATDAGGTREIVNDLQNGILIPVDADASIIKDCILKFINMEYDAYVSMREQAVDSWNKKYNAKENYTLFATELESFCINSI